MYLYEQHPSPLNWLRFSRRMANSNIYLEGCRKHMSNELLILLLSVHCVCLSSASPKCAYCCPLEMLELSNPSVPVLGFIIVSFYIYKFRGRCWKQKCETIETSVLNISLVKAWRSLRIAVSSQHSNVSVCVSYFLSIFCWHIPHKSRKYTVEYSAVETI